MTSSEIRKTFLNFFKEKGHTIVKSAPVVPFDDPTLLFTNAGMNQFKDVFLGTGSRTYSRAVNTQKCIRVSGKHNDLEEVGRDTYHHTMFEMLGNWSFGDYYKKECIQWAWELLTQVFQLPKQRLWATVYQDDDEAEHYWETVTDINAEHILRFGEKDNFWEMGETGPCGPCSEIHYDRTPNANAQAKDVNAGLPDVIEIWNLVFIQYNRNQDRILHPLPAKHVDTGMGFERLCAVLQGRNSNYDTDVFIPIITEICSITNNTYNGERESDKDIAVRVIADHIRALTFAISDGAIPSNDGRGYVLRRILRRAARFGRNLGMHEPFIYKLVPTLVRTMSDTFPEILEKQELIQKVIRSEEEGFNATLDRGLEIFEDVVTRTKKNKLPTITGDDVFRLYDTYGFPVDLTALLSRERGLKIDEQGFEKLMERQRERSREYHSLNYSTEEEQLHIDLLMAREKAKKLEVSSLEKYSRFVGYEQYKSVSEVIESKDSLVVLNETPFYGEAGGQVGDQGEIEIDNKSIRVLDTQRSGNVNVHIMEIPNIITKAQKVIARIDTERRFSIMRNHTATHLLHAALRQILGSHIHQAGSLVAPNYLRFDFTHYTRLSEEEIELVESLVNSKIQENVSIIHHRNIPFDEAKRMGALMFFGEKYGDIVNVIQSGDFSMEFCGGTHVRKTGEIGFFRVRYEGSIASGVRRIEAVTSTYALELFNLQERSYNERLEYALELWEKASDSTFSIMASNPEVSTINHQSLTSIRNELQRLKTSVAESSLISFDLKADFIQQKQRSLHLEDLILQLNDFQKIIDKESIRSRLKNLSANFNSLLDSAIIIDDIKIVSSKVSANSIEELKSLGDSLRTKLNSGTGILFSIINDKVSIVCVVTDNLVKAQKLDAGIIVSAVAKILGGGGGGRPHLATAGGKDISKIDDALAAIPNIVQSLLKQ